MHTYYIQYTTDFHLIAALGAVGDLSAGNIYLIGPRTKVVDRVLGMEGVNLEFHQTDPRSPSISWKRVIKLLKCSRSNDESTIVSPFVFPFYTFLMLLEKGERVGRIIRTDEGVGSYASMRHYYVSLRFERPNSTRLYCAALAFLKKSAAWSVSFLRVCTESYIFNPDLSINKDKTQAIQAVVERLGRAKGLNGRVIYVSQPGISQCFNSAQGYADFLRLTGNALGEMPVVKRHPADNFDYSMHGFEVVEGLPLETYQINTATVFGFSSTALLMAKIIGGCEQVYYINSGAAAAYYMGLSDFNKRLFKFNLTALSP